MTKTPLVALVDVKRRLSGKTVLNKLSLSLHPGEVVALLGRNGSGKSTLLKIISGLSPIDAGERRSRLPFKQIGFAPDRFPKLRFTAEEYLRAMSGVRGMSLEQSERRIAELMELFQLPPNSGRLRNYSKGMLQKVNLMQALLEEPELLLLDEPLSGLDDRTREELTEALVILKAKGISIVYSSHELLLAQRIADRIVRLAEGKLIDEEGARGAPLRTKRIEFRLEEAMAREACAGFEGSISRERGQAGWAVSVQADQADAFLLAVLNSGGSIVSVAEEKGRDVAE
ncbi:ATP-binding cassette domain-containing protein [Cohnella cellulosilytica]|uniref:ATP-binding cassette domain-containing protein n=1 Tax=Cohnella cellulosilytica TaxID=986710 RepID=A0ABW2FL22_9BACL